MHDFSLYLIKRLKIGLKNSLVLFKTEGKSQCNRQRKELSPARIVSCKKPDKISACHAADQDSHIAYWDQA